MAEIGKYERMNRFYEEDYNALRKYFKDENQHHFL